MLSFGAPDPSTGTGAALASALMGTQSKFMSQRMGLSEWNVFVKAQWRKEEGLSRASAEGDSLVGLLNSGLVSTRISVIKTS